MTLLLSQHRSDCFICLRWYYISSSSLSSLPCFSLSIFVFACCIFYAAVSNFERSQVLGVISLLFIFLRLGIYYVESTGRNSKFKKEADAMIDYLARRNIPDDLREEVEDYFRFRWKESQGFNDLERIRSLPASIRVHTFHSITCGIASLVDFLSIKKLGDTSFWEVMTEELVEVVQLLSFQLPPDFSSCPCLFAPFSPTLPHVPF